jgi:hypothetical protein
VFTRCCHIVSTLLMMYSGPCLHHSSLHLNRQHDNAQTEVYHQVAVCATAVWPNDHLIESYPHIQGPLATHQMLRAATNAQSAGQNISGRFPVKNPSFVYVCMDKGVTTPRTCNPTNDTDTASSRVQRNTVHQPAVLSMPPGITDEWLF